MGYKEEKQRKKKAEERPCGKGGVFAKNQRSEEFSATLSRTVTAACFQGKQRREIIQEVQKQMQEAARHAMKHVLKACLEAEVTAKLGREKGEPRRAGSQERIGDWKCGQCGCQDANQFTRDGHSQRNVETGYGHLHALPVPLVECQRCHHDVMCRFAFLETYERFWRDFHHDALFRRGLGHSLRALKERWSGQLGRPVGLRTMNEMINHGEQFVQRMQERPFPDAPTVVQCDGMWITLHTQKDVRKRDTKQRKRHERSGKKVVILVALGFWRDGRREILEWEIASSEDHAQWDIFLNRLQMRDITAEKGLTMIVRDGCGG